MYRHTSCDLYWRTGHDTARVISEKIQTYIDKPSPVVADWGCGLARVLRHLPGEFDRHGFDYNGAAINWCKENIIGIKFDKNELMPPLPARENSFDAVYALSVFTHLSEQAHEAWIGEIKRIVKPGGIFLGAFHMNLPQGQLLPHEQATFDAGRLVVRGGVKEGSRTFTAHHPEPYLRNVLFADFDIIEPPFDLFGQTLFIVRNRKQA